MQMRSGFIMADIHNIENSLYKSSTRIFFRIKLPSLLKKQMEVCTKLRIIQLYSQQKIQDLFSMCSVQKIPRPYKRRWVEDIIRNNLWFIPYHFTTFLLLNNKKSSAMSECYSLVRMPSTMRWLLRTGGASGWRKRFLERRLPAGFDSEGLRMIKKKFFEDFLQKKIKITPLPTIHPYNNTTAAA